MMAGLSIWIDESEKESLLAVGGVLVDWDAVPLLVHKWRIMKQRFGLLPGVEIKWNLPSSHPTRVTLEQLGKKTKELCEEAVKFIASSSMTCIVCVMFDERQDALWQFLRPKKAPRDFYCEALKYLLQRAAEECTYEDCRSCVVICDTPELGRRRFELASIRRGPQAVERAYTEWYNQGVGVGPSGSQHPGPLRNIGFHPSVLIGDASYHDMLQIADIVVGATRDWVAGIRNGVIDPWVVEQVKRLQARFRQRYGKPDFWGDGFVVWPLQNYLWQDLKDSLR